VGRVNVRVKLGHSEASIRGSGGEFIFSLTRGTFTVVDANGAVAIRDATARVMFQDTAYALTAGYRRMPESVEVGGPLGTGMALRVVCEPEGAGPRLVFSATRYGEIEGLFLRLECENSTGEPLVLQDLEVLCARSAEGAAIEMFPYPPAVRFYNTGATMAGSPFVDLARPPIDLKAWADSTSSELMGCFAKDSLDSRALLAGFVTADRLPSQVRFGLEPGGDRWRELVAVSELEGRPFACGERIASETLYLESSHTALAAMERYAELLGRSMRARLGGPMPSGWCSWYYFFGEVSADDIRANVERLAEQRDRYPVTHVQIDAGYQKHWGDWLDPSGMFPGGMKALADEIRSRGFTPGLWIAPFVASTVSEFARRHPDWLVAGRTGEPLLSRGWGDECPWYSLDGTHPQVQRHLEELFGVITGEWGYGAVKLDALHIGAPPGGVFRDPSATRYEAYRRGLEAIRRGCADAFVLGCNAPFGPSVGLVDGMRVSMDVGPEWGSGSGCNVRSAMRSSMRRWFFHRRVWHNDPDCLIVRAPARARLRYKGGAAVKVKGERSGLSADEAATHASVVGMLGGMAFLSDDLPSLSAERARLHELILPLFGEAARPLDLFETDPPSVLALAVVRPWESWDVAAVVNWSDHAVSRSIDLDDVCPAGRSSGRRHVFGLFDEQYYGVVKGELRLGVIAPHGVRVVCIRQVLDRPQLLSSTLHLTQGGVEIASCAWDAASRSLNFELSGRCRRSGTFFIHVPPGFGEACCRGSVGVTSQAREGAVLAVGLDVPPGGASLEVAFS
jgi:hypothetical protein